MNDCPLSYHKGSKQWKRKTAGRITYFGSDKGAALEHRQAGAPPSGTNVGVFLLRLRACLPDHLRVLERSQDCPVTISQSLIEQAAKADRAGGSGLDGEYAFQFSPWRVLPGRTPAAGDQNGGGSRTLIVKQCAPAGWFQKTRESQSRGLANVAHSS
jgi:hypothetical protein